VATLIRYGMVMLQGEKNLLGAYLPNLALLKVAGFQAPTTGWF
jgi:hypothetical protein